MKSPLPMLSVVAATALCGCTDDAPAPVPQEVGTAESQISGGTFDSSSTAVVGIVHLTQFGQGGCTGSLLSPNVVLTALHCVGNTPQQIVCPGQFFGEHQPEDMYVTEEANFPMALNDGWRSVREIVLPPFTGFCGRDVAILVLFTPFTSNEAVPMLPRLTEVQPDEIYSAVGYGQQGEGGPSGTRFRRDNLSVLCNAAGCGAPDAVYPKEWVGETGVCSGDSGGPAIDTEGRVTGVASRGAEGCDQPVYGSVFGHRDWIKETVVYAAGLEGITPPSWATEPDPGVGGGGGAGGGGVGGGTPTTGFVAGDTENKSIDGTIVGSCSVSLPARDDDGWALVALGLGLALARRRRG